MIVYLFECDNDKNRKFAISDFCQKQKLNIEKVQYDKCGKPNLQNAFISITHTYGLLGVAMSLQNVGIDVEKRNRKIKVADSIEKWTQIEAYAKYLGKGLTKRLVKQSNLPLDIIEVFVVDNRYCLSICSTDKEIQFNSELKRNIICLNDQIIED